MMGEGIQLARFDYSDTDVDRQCVFEGCQYA